jgi:hypothetical protein
VRVLRQFIEQLVTKNDILFARCDEIATWCNSKN